MPVPDADASQGGSVLVDDVLDSFSSSETLDILGISNVELERARGDSDLDETLRIIHELLVVLEGGGVLGAFLLFPKNHQTNFLRWVASTKGERVRRGRTETLLSALQASPLASRSPEVGG